MEPPQPRERRGGTTLTPISGNPSTHHQAARKAAEPRLRNPAGAAQQTPYTTASTTVALSQEAACCDHRQPPSGYRASPTGPNA
jgi:hypothetical protein